jgi:hypothetical protein
MSSPQQMLLVDAAYCHGSSLLEGLPPSLLKVNDFPLLLIADDAAGAFQADLASDARTASAG